MSKKLDEINAELRKIAMRLPELRAVENPSAEQEKELSDLAARVRDLSVKASDERALDDFEARSKQPIENPPEKKLESEKRVGIGRFLQSVASMQNSDAARRAVPLNEARSILTEARAIEGMSESVPGDGGFLVGQQDASGLMQRAYDEGKLARLCERIPISGPFSGLKWKQIKEHSRANGSRQGGILVYRASEGAAGTDSKLTFENGSMELEKLFGLVYVTDELLQDVAALEAMIGNAFGKEIGFKLDDEIINGLGAGAPLGILAAPCLVSVTKETGQSAKTVNVDNIIKMFARFMDGGNGKFVCNKDVFPQLYKLSISAGTAGYPVYIPGGSIANAPYGTILGMPVIFAEQCPTLGTVGDIMMADFSQYRLIEKGGVQAASSIHVQFLTDQTAYRFIVRNNGQPMPASAITPYKGSDTVSPFVALATRA